MKKIVITNKSREEYLQSEISEFVSCQNIKAPRMMSEEVIGKSLFEHLFQKIETKEIFELKIFSKN